MYGKGFAVADPGEGPGEARAPSLILDQNEARRAEKIFFWGGPPLYRGLDDRPPTYGTATGL